MNILSGLIQRSKSRTCPADIYPIVLLSPSDSAIIIIDKNRKLVYNDRKSGVIGWKHKPSKHDLYKTNF